MSILDTFYILFKTNAEEAVQGYKKVEAGETAFGASVARTDALVTAAGEHIVHVFENVAIRIASVFAIEKIIEFTAATTELNAQLGVTAERLGIDVQELAAWEAATKRSGGSAEGFESTLDFLNRGLADIATKGTSRLKPFFDELNIRVTDGPKKVRPLLDVLGDLSDKLSTLGKQQAAGIGEKLGIDPGTLLMLQSGRRSIEDLVKYEKELGVSTEEDTKRAHAFEQQLDDLGTIFRHLSTVIFSDALPGLTAFTAGFREVVQFIEAHKALVEGFLIGIAGIIGTVYYPAVVRAAAATLALIAEWLLIPALIVAVAAAFAFLYDDIQNFLAGNKSVIGELSKKWPEIGDVVRTMAKDVSAAFDWLVSYFKGAVNLWEGIINVVVAIFQRLSVILPNVFKTIWSAFQVAFPGIASGLEFVASKIGPLIDLFVKLLGVVGRFTLGAIGALPAALTHFGADLNSAAVSINGPKLALGGTAPSLAQLDEDETARLNKKFYGSQTAPGPIGPGATVAAMQKGQDQIHLAASTPLAAHTSNSVTNHATTVSRPVTLNIEKVEVNTQATAPADVAKAVADTLGDQTRQAINHHDDGVDR